MRVIFFTGKGGVGKSVISSATALRSSELGHETLLVSTDPAHTLSDIFGFKINSQETQVKEHLDAIQIDPVYEASKHYSALFEFISEVLKARGVDEIIAYEIANFPGATGAAALLKLVNYVEEGRYDTIILDMVPSGDALRLLYLPYLIGKLSRRFMGIVAPIADISRTVASVAGVPVPSKDVIKTQIKLLNLLEEVHNILVDHSQVSLRLIVNPDLFSIENAKRTFVQASIYDINTDLVIINKVLPNTIKDEYLKNWLELQNNYIRKCEVDFHPLPLRKISFLKGEVRGFNDLQMLSRELYGDSDPTTIYFKGEGIKVLNKENGVEIILPAPLVKKEDLEIERFGDELIIHVETFMGRSTILLPLPSIAYKYSLKSAKLINSKIHIYFEAD
ncbi:MAG: TRC40/GET3/ArsA family transport-energizing ATPase [Thermoprotei archaeon]